MVHGHSLCHISYGEIFFKFFLIGDDWLCTAAFYGAPVGEIKFINCEYCRDIFDILKFFRLAKVSRLRFRNLV